MRLDHFVQLQSTNNSNQGLTMSIKAFRSTPLPAVPRPLSCATDFWVDQQQVGVDPNDLVYGRIQDTGLNYIVEGRQGNRWVRIPCRTLLDAKLLIYEIMDKDTFTSEKPKYV
tara:strand:+ start:119 stop:457 length:339 start_codon:yes stop_codon:yes gene_type:complete